MTATVHILPSGLRVISDPVRERETFHATMFYEVGSRYETPETNGAAHALEHMFFKGTTRRSAKDISQAVESQGGSINAFTGEEYTGYTLSVMKEDMPLAFDVLSDMLLNATISEKDWNTEKGAIVQEISQYFDMPDSRAADLVRMVAFPGQPLGATIVGPKENIERMTNKDLQSFRAKNYHTGNALLCVSGSFNEKDMLELAGKHFAAIPGGLKQSFSKAAYAGGELREERDIEQTQLIISFEGASAMAADRLDLEVLSIILGGGMSSRLFQAVREEKGLAYSIYCYNQMHHDMGLFTTSMGVAPVNLAQAFEITAAQLVKSAKTILPAEVDGAKKLFSARLRAGQDSPVHRLSANALDMIFHGRPRGVAEKLETLKSVTPDSVMRMAQRVFSSKPSIAVVGPAQSLPAYDDLRRALTI